MCNEHEHHIEYSTEDFKYLCFKHAALEALQGAYIETEVIEEYNLNHDCMLCFPERKET